MTGNGLSKSKLLILVTRGNVACSETRFPTHSLLRVFYLPASFRDSAQGSCVSTAISGPSALSQKNGYTFYLNLACLSSLPGFPFFSPRSKSFSSHSSPYSVCPFSLSSFHLSMYSSICVSIHPPWHPPSECSHCS